MVLRCYGVWSGDCGTDANWEWPEWARLDISMSEGQLRWSALEIKEGADGLEATGGVVDMLDKGF